MLELLSKSWVQETGGEEQGGGRLVGPAGTGPGAGREAAEALGEYLCRLQVCQDRRWPGLGTHFSQEKAGLSKALTHQGLRALAWPGG